jgi:hypothetical protein
MRSAGCNGWLGSFKLCRRRRVPEASYDDEAARNAFRRHGMPSLRLTWPHHFEEC